MVHVLVVGSAVLDFVYRVDELPKAAEKYRAFDMETVGGGCAANAAVAISRLGQRASLLARFGRDIVQTQVMEDLTNEGVLLDLVDIAEGGRSAVSSVYVDRTGERQIMAFRGEGLSQKPAPLKLEAIDAVLADTRWPEASLLALEHARALGSPGILDGEAPIDLALAEAASHVIFSEQGLLDFQTETNVKEALLGASARLPGWVAVTSGSAGVAWVEGDHVRQMPAFKVDVKDTLGAGDVWHGAFALNLSEGAVIEEAIRFANAAAALKCTGHGGRKAAPNREQVEQFLKDNT
ncbi:PfkB family carbohydrate kinase [Litoreibacter roseus]|uniref:Ribokinase n=1 Tax=Litoreibacter roseus TaxID=2601869 RepID=A0A6N6JA23_9RHOB|nr:PfkB family carbohydrate kinase [Litoreibacter roseus]GFE62966.1 ribokinase [Litoreibacter roseus]